MNRQRNPQSRSDRVQGPITNSDKLFSALLTDIVGTIMQCHPDIDTRAYESKIPFDISLGSQCISFRRGICDHEEV